MMNYDREQLVIARDILQSFNKSVGWIDVEIDKIDNPPDPLAELHGDIVRTLSNEAMARYDNVATEVIRVFRKSKFWKDPEDEGINW